MDDLVVETMIDLAQQAADYRGLQHFHEAEAKASKQIADETELKAHLAALQASNPERAAHVLLAFSILAQLHNCLNKANLPGSFLVEETFDEIARKIAQEIGGTYEGHGDIGLWR